MAKTRGRKTTASTPSAKKKGDAKGRGKVRVTFYLDLDLIEQCRDAVVALSGPPEQLTLAAVADGALRSELKRLRRKHNQGEPFPSRKGMVRRGRPIGT